MVVLAGLLLSILTISCTTRIDGSGRRRWAPAGCSIQGCPAGSYCDKHSGYCETQACGDRCPDGSKCNKALDRCEDPDAPLRTVDDLPGDPDPANPAPE
jgi:hypothetical protein